MRATDWNGDAALRPPGARWGVEMKAFVMACIVAVVVAVAAAAVLNGMQKPVSQAFATSGVRL